MTAEVESGVGRVARRVDGRSWLRWGVAVLVGIETVHTVGGVLVNEWEGWGTFFGNLSFIVVTGLVIVGLTFGLLVRWALKPAGDRNRPARASLIAGMISVVSYVIFFTWAPVLVAPAAVLLAREGLARAREGQGRRGFALAGGFLGLASLALQAFFLIYALTHQGDYPWGL